MLARNFDPTCKKYICRFLQPLGFEAAMPAFACANWSQSVNPREADSTSASIHLESSSRGTQSSQAAICSIFYAYDHHHTMQDNPLIKAFQSSERLSQGGTLS